ncbi:Isochorismatase hydrolase [Calocera viscosa TUFC12733]|uniref:Isochorismatase hydrolase n=1 Tax=Calocera viscosa (strain TUFC12733) TaxID=1330018 RepID=A0A167MUM7_CALVF|nr:Isochorismatase hydrolase [Calocera viscosa TUFC12733]
MPPLALLICDYQTPLRARTPEKEWFDSSCLLARELLLSARALGPEQAWVVHVICAAEPILPRPRVSAFHDTPLNAQLRSLNVTRLLLCGVATSGVVLATFRSAVDADYDVMVVPDACADRDRVLHDALVDRFFARGMGRVLSVQEAKLEMAK